jgi:hypothetical protein
MRGIEPRLASSTVAGILQLSTTEVDMEQKTERPPQQEASSDTRIALEISLVRRGPFYRAQEVLRLLRPERCNLGRRIAVAIGVGWLPLVVLTLVLKPATLGDLLRDYTVNMRLLIALPVLLAGQILMETVFRTIVRHIREAELLSSEEQAKMDLTLSRIVGLSDSLLAEGVIVVLAYLNLAARLQSGIGIAQAWALNDMSTGPHVSAAGWYYALVSLLLYQLLLGISLWKWLLWIFFLFRLSRLDLHLVSTHPDHNGGLGFLGVSSLAIAPTIFVAAAAIGSTWRTQILMHGMHLMDFRVAAAVLLATVLVIALGPLVFFVPKLLALRHKGILQYGVLGQLHSTGFHKKWILNRRGHEEEFLAAPEISSLIDYSSSYENVEKLRLFPIDRASLIAVVLAVTIPLLPVVLAEIPFVTVLKGLLSAVK